MFLLVLLLETALAKRYNTHSAPRADKLNVHIVSHTHDDPGWLKTVDQYYYGANKSITHSGVQYILASVVKELQHNPDRKFVYCEMAYFMRWWAEQSPEMQSTVKQLISTGQLDFVSGGYVMHDEAAPWYTGMIDQMAYGHDFLQKTFGFTPRVGWQLDPFGHSTFHSVLSAQSGFSALFIGRIDKEDRLRRIDQGKMEFIWQGSQSLPSASIWTSADFGGGYGPPDGLCFDEDCVAHPVQDDPNIEDYNVNYLVEKFVAEAKIRATAQPGNNVLFKMGEDFQYSGARQWYKNLDKLIHYVNQDGRVNTFYSTPTLYAQAQQQLNNVYTQKTDDFFPYADNPHAYWSGYFTSRVLLKRYIHYSVSYLNTARQLNFAALGDGSGLIPLTEATALAHHHDGITGTSKQHVAYDYALQLSQGTDAANSVISSSLASLINDKSVSFSFCHLVNETRCASTLPLSSGSSVVMVVWNPTTQQRSPTFRIPVPIPSVQIFNNTGGRLEVEMQASDLSAIPIDTPGGGPILPYIATAIGFLPPLGLSTYYITPSSLEEQQAAEKKMSYQHQEQTAEVKQSGAQFALSNQFFQALFDSTTGSLFNITDFSTGVSTAITQEFLWYKSYHGGEDDPTENSGAYIFRPTRDEAANQINYTVTYELRKFTLYSEVRQYIAPWLNHTMRVYINEPFLESEWTIGPIPIDDNNGKEVISRYTSDIKSNSIFFTDSNGRDMLQRVRDYQPSWNWTNEEPVGGNYYPVPSAIAIKDSTRQLTITTDRSEGGSSIRDGQIELMIHRRLLADDHRGVGEPLNETAGITQNAQRIGVGIVAKGTHRIFVSTPAKAAATWRVAQQNVFHFPVPAFAPLTTTQQQWTNTHTTIANYAVPLPQNVELLTLLPLGGNQAILRLAHIFGTGEDATLSQSASVNLSTLFTQITVTDVVELTLTANQVKTSSSNGSNEASLQGPPGVITLGPLEIRTFKITYTPKLEK